MFNVSDEAAVRLAEMLYQVDAPEKIAIRLFAPPSRPDVVTLRLDYPQAGDETFCRQGRTILLVDKRAASRVGSCSLVLETLPGGCELVLKPPEAA